MSRGGAACSGEQRGPAPELGVRVGWLWGVHEGRMGLGMVTPHEVPWTATGSPEAGGRRSATWSAGPGAGEPHSHPILGSEHRLGATCRCWGHSAEVEVLDGNKRFRPNSECFQRSRHYMSPRERVPRVAAPWPRTSQKVSATACHPCPRHPHLFPGDSLARWPAGVPGTVGPGRGRGAGQTCVDPMSAISPPRPGGLQPPAPRGRLGAQVRALHPQGLTQFPEGAALGGGRPASRKEP